MSELKNELQNLSNETWTVYYEYNRMNSKIQVIVLEDKVRILETKSDLINSSTASQIIEKLLDWQFRFKNTLLFNLSENAVQNNLND